MVILYIFGCVQQLELGVKIVIVCAVSGWCLGAWALVTRKQNRFSILRQGCELAVLFALALVLSWGAEYWVWDEFSHWGAEAEYLTLTNNLPTNKEILVFPNYIPGISLLRYFAEIFLSGSGVSSSYFITWLFSLSTIYCISYSESRAKWGITIGIVFFAYLAFFQALTLTLLIDPLQSLVFLFALRFAQKNDNDSFRIMLLAVIAVVLLKHVGLILGTFVWIYYVCMRRFVDRLPIKAMFARSFVLLGVVLSTYLSWGIYVAAYDLGGGFAGLSIMFGGPGLTENVSIGLHHVLTNLFPHATFLPPAYPLSYLASGIPLWLFICITAGAALILTYNRVSAKNEMALTFIFLLFTVVSYLLFLSYVAVASGWFNDIYSFSRYFIVVLFATFLLQYFVVRDQLSVMRCLLIAVFMIGAAFVTAPSLNVFFVKEKRLPVPLNEEYRVKAEQLKKHTTGIERILYVDGRNSSFGYFIFRLKTLPLRFASYSSTAFINQSSMDDAKNLELFKKELCKFDYIYADDAPESFWMRNGQLFDVVGGHVYRVNRNETMYCAAILIDK
ncbi:hypothetical protein [Pseudomonas atacamensis]|uniref:hypothetical protein n=1 Tax=Pseudomonas atacamensis TaxID=2565368 RepID=UPI0037F904D1